MKQKAFKILVNKMGAFKKWDKIRSSSNGGESIIIKVDNSINYGNTLTVYPIKKSKYRVINAVRLFVIKLKVFFGLIK